ncbi:glycosyltransferase [Microbacterium deminutum]|uniref:4,4'-diaponeurosporenoate glycosyltransferase n=1 Tax=Microbacterium deminutum TaxID=344164 RepID=A0ABN2QH89_9MICO
MTGGEVSAVIVVVPVHNEEALLDRSLTALAAAVATAAGCGIRCAVRIVLDDCTDGSAAVAGVHPIPTMVLASARVGEARAQGIEAAKQELAGTAADRVWIANTDADSAVPPNWIVAQSHAAARGADVFVGTVRPDFADLSGPHRRHWLRTHSPGVPNGHVHGANLGVRASFYAAAGGFGALAEHEDVDLVDRCRLLGANICASDAAEVLTSGRFVGRTPGGYAGYLRAQAGLVGRRGIRSSPAY